MVTLTLNDPSDQPTFSFTAAILREIKKESTVNKFQSSQIEFWAKGDQVS